MSSEYAKAVVPERPSTLQIVIVRERARIGESVMIDVLFGAMRQDPCAFGVPYYL
jgi:hypothetical protein